MQRSVLRPAQEKLGATFTEVMGCEVADHFTDPTEEWEVASQTGGRIDLSGFGVIRVSGSDARDYLHRRTSADVNALAVGEGCHALTLQPGGRIIAEMGLHRICETDFVALTSPVAAKSLAEDLEKFLFTEDCLVQLSPISVGPLAVIGQEALVKTGDVIGVDLNGLPEWGCAVAEDDVWVLRMHMTSEPMVALVSHGGECTALWEKLGAAGCQAIGWNALNTLRVESGTPLFGIDHNSSWLPTDAGIDASAVDYDKGCFPGQEALAKIKNFSHPRSVLRRVRLAGEGLPALGVALTADGKPIGDLSSICHSPQFGKAVGICHLKWRNRDTTQCAIIGDDGQTWQAEVIAIPSVEAVQ